MTDRPFLIAKAIQVGARINEHDDAVLRVSPVAHLLLSEASDVIEELVCALHRDEVDHGDADAGVTAKPWRSEDDRERGPPKPDENGRFLLIMHDRNVSGQLWMRRYATKEDAICVSANYSGAEQVWLYEVDRELDLNAEERAYIDNIKWAEG